MNRHFSSKIFSFFIILMLALPLFSAQAEDCFVIDVDFLDMDLLRDSNYIAEHLSASASGIRIQKYISNSGELAARVRLTIVQMDTNTLIFDKNYGYQSKTFDSGNIYLPNGGDRTVPYLITLYVEDWVYAMPYMQLMPRLSYNGACTYGVRMGDYNPALTNNWLMGTMLDLNLLRQQGQMSVPICASNAFIIGETWISMANESLTVSLSFLPQASAELHQTGIYFIENVSELTNVEPHNMPQRAYMPGESIPVSSPSAATALLYIPMTVSYNSAGLSPFLYNPSDNFDLQRQLALWNENMNRTPEMFPLIPLDPPIEEIPPSDAFPPDTVIPEMIPPENTEDELLPVLE